VANHPSALKRHRQSRKRRTDNRSAKSRLQSMTRQVLESVTAGNKAEAEARLREAAQALSKAASKGLVHSANAARRTSRLARRVAAMS
jgi:small subunit ribosomal protein S20